MMTNFSITRMALYAGVSMLAWAPPSVAHAQDQSPTAPARSGTGSPEEAQTANDIVVTAQKREQRLQDTPVPVTALVGTDLTDTNQVRLQDYYYKVPGLALSEGYGGMPLIAIRGITTGGFTNPTVGIVLDEAPFSLSVGTNSFAPDIDPSELQRVEVLRGPQGTLYGAASIGGLVKYVTIQPSTDRISGRVQGGLTATDGGADLGYNWRAALNLPVSQDLAVRISGYTGRDPGFIRNIQTGEQGVNYRDNDGARLALLWRPAETLSITLSALMQNSRRHGSDEVDRNLNGFEHDLLAGTGTYDRKRIAYSALIEGEIGGVQATSVTAYNIDRLSASVDQTASAGGFFTQVANDTFGVDGSANEFRQRVRKFSQEVRFTIPVTSDIQWTLGGFYTKEDVASVSDFLGVNSATGEVAGSIGSFGTPTSFREYAAFTNLAVQLTDRFDVQFGLRASWNRQSLGQVRTGPLSLLFFGVDPSVQPAIRVSDNSITYLVTPRFRVSDDLMIYARFASGYRPGGPNPPCGVAGVPCSFNADRTQNYEVGIKGNILDRAITFDASVYYIDWSDIQTNLLAPDGANAFTANAGQARSKGVELALELRPTRTLTISASGSYNDASLTRDLPPTATIFAREGDRLPYSSRFTGSLSVEQRFPIASEVEAFVGATASYVGARRGIFQATPVRTRMPAYEKLDLTAGVRWDNWSVSAYLNNVTNSRGILRNELDSSAPNFVTYIQPRSAGLSIARSF